MPGLLPGQAGPDKSRTSALKRSGSFDYTWRAMLYLVCLDREAVHAVAIASAGLNLIDFFKQPQREIAALVCYHP